MSDGTFYIVRPATITASNMTTNIEQYAPVLWTSGVSFNFGTVVHYNDVLYYSISVANLNHQPDTSPLYWTAVPGSPTAYNPATTYGYDTVVIDNGLLYIRNNTGPATSTGEIPGENPGSWIPLISQTKMWDAGETYAVGDVVFTTGDVSNPNPVYESLVASNIGNDPEASPTEWRFVQRGYQLWGPSTSYSITEFVVYNRKLYQSLVGSNAGNQPDESSTEWQDKGPAPGWEPFDDKTGTQATRPGELTYTFTLEGRYDTIGFINIAADNVNIKVNGGTDYDEDFNLVATEEIYDFYTFYLEQPTLKDRLFVNDIPSVLDPVITVTLTGDAVAVGLIVPGRSRMIGTTLEGASLTIQDFSDKRPDGFGGFYINERGFSDEGSFTVRAQNAWASGLKRLFDSIRAKPILYIADERFTCTYIYGWSVPVITFDTPTTISIKFEVKGL